MLDSSGMKLLFIKSEIFGIQDFKNIINDHERWPPKWTINANAQFIVNVLLHKSNFIFSFTTFKNWKYKFCRLLESCFIHFLTNLSDCFLIPTFCVSTAYAKIISVNICSFYASEFEQEKKNSQVLSSLSSCICIVLFVETEGTNSPLHRYIPSCIITSVNVCFPS